MSSISRQRIFKGVISAANSPPLRTTQAATANKTVEEQASSIPGGDIADLPVAIPPEEPAANQNGKGLDQEIR